MLNPKLFKKLAIGAIIAIFAIVIAGNFISTSNTEVDLRTLFNQKIDERTAYYDKMWKTISQGSQIAIRNDSSFQRIVDLQVTGQKNGEQVVFAWIKQSNPAATFGEVTKLYQELARTIDANRTEFFQEEKALQDIKREHDRLRSRFPSNIYLAILGRKALIYKPITSDRTDNVIKTGKDNDVNLF